MDAIPNIAGYWKHTTDKGHTTIIQHGPLAKFFHDGHNICGYG